MGSKQDITQKFFPFVKNGGRRWKCTHTPDSDYYTQTDKYTSMTACKSSDFKTITYCYLKAYYTLSRHVLLSAGSDFTDRMWQIVLDGVQNTIEVTTYCMRQLMLLFKANSENFYGDIGQVKVATRKDCSPMEFVRMWHLAQQVGTIKF